MEEVYPHYYVRINGMAPERVDELEFHRKAAAVRDQSGENLKGDGKRFFSGTDGNVRIEGIKIETREEAKFHMAIFRDRIGRVSRARG